MFTAQRISPSYTAVAQPATAAKSTPFFQPKLTVNTPGDAYEQEADRVADQVMRMQNSDAPVVQRMPITPLPVQRKCAHCEKEEKAMRKETGGGDAGGQAAPAAVSDVLSSGSGQPMDAGTRQWAESRFGQDFSQVRVHTDARAADSAAAIQARAYTSGSNVVFGAGEYQPQSESGQRLLAHELVHVGQQGGGDFLPVIQRRVNWTNSLLGGFTGATLGAIAGGVVGGLLGNPLLGAGIGAGIGLLAGLVIGGTINPTRFDPQIDHTNKTLTLVMRVGFNFSNEKGNWTSQAEKQQFVSNFITTNQNTWSCQYFLQKTRGTNPALNGDVYAAKLRIVRDERNPHYRITAYHSATDYRSSVNMDVNTAEFNHVDNSTGSYPTVCGPGSASQVTAAHEMGHMLGLDHVRCDNNSDSCYGVTCSEQQNIMGMGSSISPRDYQPFVDAIRGLTNCDWVATASPTPPASGAAPAPPVCTP